MEQYRSMVIDNYEKQRGGGFNEQKFAEILSETIQSNASGNSEDGIDRISRLAELLAPLLQNLPAILGTTTGNNQQTVDTPNTTGQVSSTDATVSTTPEASRQEQRLSAEECATIVQTFATQHPKLLASVRKGIYPRAFCIANLKAQNYTEADAKAIYEEAMK
jgi:hypothetical protein